MYGTDLVSTRRSNSNAPKYARYRYQKPPGRPVGVIAKLPIGHKEGRFNPLVMFFTVSPYRKDFNRVVEQSQRGTRLPKYEKDLFNSCFKNW